jgi:alpha-tubulin suppressor-like RCC1 family protein
VDCWGLNGNAQLGDGTDTNRVVPTPVTPALTGATAVSAGFYSTCAIADGALYCWGSNGNALVANGMIGADSYANPVPVAAVTSGATAVSVGEEVACAVVDGAAVCWGFVSLGDGLSEDTATSPVSVIGLSSGVTAIAAGVDTACAVANGAAYCWGSNSAAQLGDGTPPDELAATLVAGFP